MKRLTLAMFIACGAVTPAQQQQPVMIPKDLVMLLMRGGMGAPSDGYDIVLGAPDGFPPELLPRGAKPLISTVSRSGTMLIAEAPELTPDLTRLEQPLIAAGWTISPRSAAQPQRGLLGAPAQGSSLWCNGSRFASVMVFPRLAGGSYVRISVSDSALTPQPAPMSPCTPINQPAPIPWFADIDMPLLFPPAGSRAVNSGVGMGGGAFDSYDQRLRLETTLTLPEVLQHYRAQIEKHGWTFQSQAVAEGIGVVRFAVPSTKKEPVAATLTVMAVPGPPPIEIGLHLVRAASRPYGP